MTQAITRAPETDGARLRRYRIWGAVMVGICFLSGLVAYGGARYSFGVFMKPMSEAMGWSRTQMSLGATINLICYAVASPVIGRMMDRLGVKATLLIGAPLAGLGLMSLYFLHSLWQFYVLYGVVVAIGSNMVGRIAQATIVANWFIKGRGIALGITAVSIGLGTSVFAPVANAILHAFNWQTAFVFLGGTFFALVLLPAVIFIKGRGLPEDRGFGPDGAPLESARSGKGAARRPAGPDDWTVAEAFRTWALWGLFIALGLSYMGDYIVLFHGVAAFQDRGLSAAAATAILAVGTLVSSAGRLGFGWLVDHLSARTCIAVMLAVQITAMPFVIAGGASTAMLYTFAIVWGLGYGGLATLLPAVSSEYFGRRNFGAIFGFVTMATVLGGAIGSTFGGWVYDTRGDYELAWYASIAMRAVAAVAVFTMARKPRKKAPSVAPALNR